MRAGQAPVQSRPVGRVPAYGVAAVEMPADMPAVGVAAVEMPAHMPAVGVAAVEMPAVGMAAAGVALHPPEDRGWSLMPPPVPSAGGTSLYDLASHPVGAAPPGVSPDYSGLSPTHRALPPRWATAPTP